MFALTAYPLTHLVCSARHELIYIARKDFGSSCPEGPQRHRPTGLVFFNLRHPQPADGTGYPPTDPCETPLVTRAQTDVPKLYTPTALPVSRSLLSTLSLRIPACTWSRRLRASQNVAPSSHATYLRPCLCLPDSHRLITALVAISLSSLSLP